MRRYMLVATLVAITVFFAACGEEDEGVSTAASDVSCDDVSTELDEAQAELASSESELEEVDTPAASEVEDDVDSLKADVAALNARSDECDSATTTTTTPVEEDLGLTEEQTAELANALSDVYVDFRPGEVDMGTGNIPDSPEERGDASFTKDTIETREDLPAFFASDNPKAQRARSRVESSLRAAGYGDEEVELALTSGERWIWVSPNVEHQVLGTTYDLNGEIYKADSWRQVAPKDAIWWYITTDAKIVNGAAVRADCGNPEVDKVRPVRPGTPPAAPIECPKCPPPPPPSTTPETPRCPPDMPHGTPPLCKDGPENDGNVNPDVPPQPRGPGATPVGGDPGPPREPVDSPTGCTDRCDEDDGFPSTTTTTRPNQGQGDSGNGGTNTTTPPTTEAPAPAPPTTASPSPSTTNPPPPPG
ncbi:MAG: hypothetical protein U5L95_05340 [Candidatus Saccharibacteria bacterium]|nr:hypothetical protein [Candidatus Saccharibacteria bacterium]